MSLPVGATGGSPSRGHRPLPLSEVEGSSGGRPTLSNPSHLSKAPHPVSPSHPEAPRGIWDLPTHIFSCPAPTIMSKRSIQPSHTPCYPFPMSTNDITLDSLTRAIKLIQDTIRQDGRTVGANETRTRNTLIDPLLSALGWADPSVLTQEYLIRYGPREFEYGVVDYALHSPADRANPVAFVEAKRMSEDLTDDHRLQVLKYARDKGGKLRHFVLTNGDRWELYELFEGEPLELLKFSVHTQAASDCANLLLSHFPILERPRATGGPSHTQSMKTAAHNVKPIYPASAVDIIPPRRPTNHADVPKVLTWLAVSLIIAGILGWISGVWNAEPIEGFFEYVGLFTILIGLILVTMIIRRFYPTAIPTVLGIMRLRWLFAPINGNRRKTFLWIVLAIVFGIGVGGLSGHFVGLQTGPSIVNALRGLGQVVVTIVIIVIVILVVAAIVRNSGKGGRGGWGSRSSYRKWR